ncbi:hypothetical protein GCM10023335_34080 [Streptomyces siamensis]|uniref:Uncharacterized protein n=1 Tax=Streptomyces siamensis TaxID=1274986 RepID=A0ABP9IVZ6_9ACTN
MCGTPGCAVTPELSGRPRAGPVGPQPDRPGPGRAWRSGPWRGRNGLLFSGPRGAGAAVRSGPCGPECLAVPGRSGPGTSLLTSARAGRCDAAGSTRGGPVRAWSYRPLWAGAGLVTPSAVGRAAWSFTPVRRGPVRTGHVGP